MGKRIKQIIISIICFMIYFNGKKISRLLLLFLKTDNKMLISFLTNTIIAVILILIYRKELIKELKLFKNNFKKFMSIGFEYWLIGLGFMVLFNIAIVTFTSAGGAANEKAVQALINSYPLIMLLETGIIAPICEEILFRKCFKNIFSNPRTFIIVSSFIFGFLHIIYADSIGQMLYILPYSSLGVAMAMMYQKTDSIYTSMSIHIIHNLLLTIISII